jgi:hypothetical protein
MSDKPFDLWLEFEVWQAAEINLGGEIKTDPPLDDDFFNMAVTLSNGEKYAMNVWTYKYFDRKRIDGGEDHEFLGGRYFIPPDLLVERLDRAYLEEVVGDMVEHGSLKPEWLVTPGS